MKNTHQKRCERASIAEWVANDNYSHAITLNTDRELSLPRLKGIFSTFSHQFDKRVHGIRNMARFPADLRMRAIVFPENLATNAHLHGFADFASALNVLGNEWLLKEEVRVAWLKTTRGAGSVDLQTEPDSGWAGYCTKRYDGTFFFAADFHSH